MRFNKIFPIFLVRRIGKATNFSEFKNTRQFMLFSLCLFLFLGATELSLKAKVDSLEQMGVLRPTETIDAPDFVLPDLEGKQISLRKFQGKFVMLNFWATW